MLKLLPVVLILLAISGGLIYFRFFASKSEVVTPQTVTTTESEDQPLNQPEEVPSELPTPTPSPSTPPPAAANSQNISDLDSRLKAAEASVTELKLRVLSLEKGTTTTQTAKAPLYIPLGSGGSSSVKDWTSLNTYEISLDPADYAGYKDMQLEVNFRLPDLVGTAYARLFNSTDNAAISNELSTTSGNFVWQTSSGFKLTSGKKTYKLQLKSSEAKTVEVQSARIKVNF